MSTSRWLTWTPKGAVTEKMPDPGPPKPSKVHSGGFEGPVSAHSPIIERPSVGATPNLEDAQSLATAAAPDLKKTLSQVANSVPGANVDGVIRWIEARCVIRRDTWSSEKSLWSDYVGWRQQQKVPVVPREQFAEILDRLFQREMDGCSGIALAIDVADSPYIM